jgi:thiol-disulfide isomerase/thioredoxin
MFTLKFPKVNLSSMLISRKALVLVLVAALLIGVSVYIFRTYISNKVNPTYVDNKEFTAENTDNNEAKEATLLLFHVNWCMYCKKAMPEWNKFKNDYDGKVVKGYKLVFKEYECSDDNNEETNSLLDKYDVDGYPTIILVKDGVKEKFDAKPTYDSLEEFVKTM